MEESTTDGGLVSIDAERSEIDSRDVQDRSLDVHGSKTVSRGQKRPADESLEEAEEANGAEEVEATTGDGPPTRPVSKNRLKKLKEKKSGMIDKLANSKNEERSLHKPRLLVRIVLQPSLD